MISRFFEAWGKLPWRKPVAMALAVVDLYVILRSCCTNIDLPPNTTTFLIWVNGTIMSLAFGTSAYESIKKDEIKESIDLANIMQGDTCTEKEAEQESYDNRMPYVGREREESEQ